MPNLLLDNPILPQAWVDKSPWKPEVPVSDGMPEYAKHPMSYAKHSISWQTTPDIPHGAVITFDTGKMEVTVKDHNQEQHFAINEKMLHSGSFTWTAPTPPTFDYPPVLLPVPEPLQEPVYLDLDAATALLQRAVEDRGEHFQYLPKQSQYGLFSACRYFHGEQGAPGCIVGLAMSYLGLSNKSLATMDTCGGIGGATQRAHLHSIGVTMSEQAVALFRGAQRRQDAGMSWGRVLQEAVAEAKLA